MVRGNPAINQQSDGDRIQMNDQSKFKTILISMAELYGKEVSGSVGQIYWTSLKEFSDEEVTQAFQQAVNTLKFFPKPAEIREIIQGSSVEQAHEAWGRVMHDLERGRFTLTDNIEEIVTNLGGRRKLALMPYRDLEFLKKDFVELFEAKADRGLIPALPNNVRKISND